MRADLAHRWGTVGLSDAAPVVAGGPVPTFDVRDLDAVRGFLEGKGIQFEGDTEVHEGLAKLATFFDPDGHRLMLAQDLQGGET